MGKVSAPSCTELLKGALEGGASCMKLKKQASNNSLDICPLLVIQDNTKRNCVAKNFTKILLPSLVELLVELKKKNNNNNNPTTTSKAELYHTRSNFRSFITLEQNTYKGSLVIIRIRDKKERNTPDVDDGAAGTGRKKNTRSVLLAAWNGQQAPHYF
jgi:hypothetical protein